MWSVSILSLSIACGAKGDAAELRNAQPLAPSRVTLTIETESRHQISPFIYGLNFAEKESSTPGHAPWYGAPLPEEVTLNRFGGNRLSTFNWVTGWSNTGGDGDYANDDWLTRSADAYDYGQAVGSAVAGRVNSSFARKQAMLLTIPMVGYVAGDASGAPLSTTDADRARRLAGHFKRSRAFKGAPFSLSPSPGDPVVFQDEFVNWVKATWPDSTRDPRTPVFFSLDNEPDSWTSTHKEILSDIGDDPKRPRIATYDAFIDTSISYAKAIKSVLPSAQVFGPAVATYTGLVALGRYTEAGWVDDPVHGRRNFGEIYLDRMRQAGTRYGRRLLDVFDIHYYSAAGTGGYAIGNDHAPQSRAMIEARLQAPRSLWDPSYNEGSWVNGVTEGPIELLPRLRRQIATHYPGTKLAVTEYFFGRGGDISGGLAQADALGIFGREGVFAAALWPAGDVWAPPFHGEGGRAYAFALGAFTLFRNFDGAGGCFGDTGVAARTSDPVGSSVYASLDAQDRLVIVAINKRVTERTTATIDVATARPRSRVVGVFRLTSESPTPSAVKWTEVSGSGHNSFLYVMPPMSATVIVVAP